MPSFEYQAVNPQGKKLKGFLDADSERHARQQLRDKQLMPINLHENHKRGTTSKRGGGRVSTRDLSLFTQQFAALIQSATPLEEAIQVSANQTNNKALKRTLQAVRSKILEGHTLADSLRDHPRVFPPIYCALISAGEHSGDLAKVLMRLADYTERTQQLRNTVSQAAIYPIVLTIVALGVITLLMAYVVPKVVEQFDGRGQELPLLTRIMIASSDFIIHQGWMVLVAVFAGIWVWRHCLKKPGFRLRVHAGMLKLPILGNLITNLETARLLNTLSIMVTSGSPLLDALRISQETLNNRVIRNAVSEATDRVREGQLLSKTLNDSGVFPPISVYMIANGEHSGELGTALEHAARQQENLLTGMINITTKLLEPLLIIVFGVLVLAIVLAILLPILQLNNLTQF
ncbi:MAG: type II secretion system inner membrane protein GspF [Neptunomonas phycophila]|uniref:type II secretion system inner membrane protein GspF n=1 Tax=Neptunomonas phycophila TaxID=1572645 RepID=UPI003B8B5D40